MTRNDFAVSKRRKQTWGHRGPWNRCSSCGLDLHHLRKIKPQFNYPPRRSPYLIDAGHGWHHLFWTSCWLVPLSGILRDLKITTVNWSSLAACSVHVDSDLIRHNQLPWANFKECPPGVCTETLQGKCSFDVTERKKSKAFIWWRELWLFFFLSEAERKVFGCETSTKRKSCSRKTACAAKYALWWVGKLSDSTVFLTLERVYRIHNHKFSQNHASETHGSTGSIVAAG